MNNLNPQFIIPFQAVACNSCLTKPFHIIKVPDGTVVILLLFISLAISNGSGNEP